MILLEFDKAGAEWVVVAYLSGDARMLDIVENKKSPHIVTGSLISGAPEDIVKLEHKAVDKASDPEVIERLRAPIMKQLEGFFLPRTMSIRQAGKKSNHGLNYNMKYKRFALENEIEEREAKVMVEKYRTEAYPGIPQWHAAIDNTLRTTRTLTNCFGRKVVLLDAWGEELRDKAYSFIPQSTIVDIVNKSMIAAYEDTTPAFRDMDLLNQSHDSVTFQFPVDDFHLLADFTVRYAFEYMSPEIEYNQRRFKVGTDLKMGTSWGQMEEVRLVDNAQEMAGNLRDAWDRLHASKATEGLVA